MAGDAVSLQLCPVTLREARAWVTEHHRHHEAPVGGLFAVGVMSGPSIVGVAIVGRPVARMLVDDFTAEVTRCCTDGSRNACSMLYRACWRAARALGYQRLVTYTLEQEGGRASERRVCAWSARLVEAHGTEHQGRAWTRTQLRRSSDGRSRC
jgi:hypothetical protein